MTWVDLSTAFQYGTKLTSSNQQQLRDNIAAAFGKDAGAPQLATDYIVTSMITDLNVTEAKLAAAVYGQDKVKTSTGGAATNLAAGTSVAISMQDYCFFPSVKGSETYLELRAAGSGGAGTTGAFGFWNTDSVQQAYDVDWRYITATDEPFIFILRHNVTGLFEHLWFCGDPPPGYWGLSEKPVDFKPPIGVSNPQDYTEITKFRFSQKWLDDLVAKRNTDKKAMIEVMNDFEYDDQTKLFKSKNLAAI